MRDRSTSYVLPPVIGKDYSFLQCEKVQVTHERGLEIVSRKASKTLRDRKLAYERSSPQDTHVPNAHLQHKDVSTKKSRLRKI